MKKVLIISPHFPPVNAADMHRVRQMLNYTNDLGWIAEVVTVDPKYSGIDNIDELLLKTVPESVQIHRVKAFDKNFSIKFGIGSISLRSFLFFRMKVNEILRNTHFDLIFFSTTAFHVLSLGPYWKKKFGIPFIIDIQDPWRNDYYLAKPRCERPPKFWFNYWIDKYLESRTVPHADGIISVSKGYLNTFHDRYKNFKVRCEVIPFAGHLKDFEIIGDLNGRFDIDLAQDKINIIYVGRGGYDMSKSVNIYFLALAEIKITHPDLYSRIKTSFYGTSYSPMGTGVETLKPVGLNVDPSNDILESTDRLNYFTTLKLLTKADILFIPGSTDIGYTASKIYPYIIAEKPIIACFHEKSSAVEVLTKCTNSDICVFDSDPKVSNCEIEQMYACILNAIEKVGVVQNFNKLEFNQYLSLGMSSRIVGLFNEVVDKNNGNGS